MGIFQQFPYSNFHEMNLDQIIKIMREMQDEWVATKAEWASYKDFIDNYFANLNLDEETEKALRVMLADGTLDPVIDPVIAAAAAAWLADHITQPTTPAIDTSLTVSGAAADAKVAGDAINIIKNELILNNAFDVLLPLPRVSEVKSGITYTWTDNKCLVAGTATSASFNNIFGSNTSLPYGMKAGEKYYVDHNNLSGRVFVQIFQMSSNGNIVALLYSARTSGWFTVPAGIDGMVVRLYVNSGETVNETVAPRILNQYGNDILSTSGTIFLGDLLAGSDLNNVTGGCWLLPSNYSYVNSPMPNYSYGTLFHFEELNVKFQVIVGGGDQLGKLYVRTAINGVYGQWSSIEGGGSSTNNYYFDSYENTYNVTATPTITTDTNSYLAPTGDSTDVTASIIAMLNQTGVCRLGKGDYYVSNLVMPAGTEIVGSGYGTRVILRGSSDGFAIKMTDHCVVKDIQILGNTTDITVSATVGNRHGILWQGTYTQDQQAPVQSIIDNVFIKNFTGGGITCYDTGYGTFNCLEVTNAHIWLCNAGINISYWSEFHKFTNVRAGNCYYGCINNGGNNIFTNCDFSSNKLAFLMDNAQGQSPNNSHGSCVGCTFNHTDNNAGIGIRILNCDSGFIFTGCQIFYSKTSIEDSDGVVISDTNFGLNNCDITSSFSLPQWESMSWESER